ncbi:phosphatase PAP2 family protein [Sphingomonas sp. AP4-R1]|uniref:acid phosphatase n=1 Tax=Sphingomonas sp. AP4-R1 TaxID=2735134 RepID=UPI0014933381|nr:phosphatase PAP2 family protein [Sphingomonas sp. AP4-R1]QJU59838.1 phosphatase PAP2 family protein [Sphingomonas sp. AP4-R1]
MKVVMVLALAGIAVGAVAATDAPRPYLADVPKAELIHVLPPPPASGSAEEEADRRIFRETRALEGSPRWQLATHDVTDDRFTTFACAMGMKLDRQSAPALARVFDRMGGVDLVASVKSAYQRRRPYLDVPGPICEPKTAHLAGNGDYPSGHTTAGWSTALVLAELMPDRATAILRRGRVYGESRYLCGAHSKSAVEAGYLAGSAMVALLHASPDFAPDMLAARRELKDLRSKAPSSDPARCTLENESSRNARPNRAAGNRGR